MPRDQKSTFLFHFMAFYDVNTAMDESPNKARALYK